MRKFVLYGSPVTRRALKVAAWVLIVGSLPALVWPPLFPAMVLSGLTLLVVSWRIVVPDASCVLCQRPRLEVLALIAGENAGVCDACSVTAAALSTRDQFARATSRALWAMSVLHVLPELTPNSASTGLLLHAATLEGVDRNAVLAEAERLCNHHVKVTLYEAIEAAARSPSEWINYGVALNAVGRHEDALAATRRATDAPNEPWLLNNVAAIKLRMGTTDFEALHADCSRAQALLKEQKPHSWEAALTIFINNLAELELKLGRPQLALERLDESVKRAPANVRSLLTRYAALTALGRHDEAKAVAAEAQRVAHPDAPERAEVDALR